MGFLQTLRKRTPAEKTKATLKHRSDHSSADNTVSHGHHVTQAVSTHGNASATQISHSETPTRAADEIVSRLMRGESTIM
jgi:hypothetical protein